MERDPNTVGQVYQFPPEFTDKEFLYYNQRMQAKIKTNTVILCLKHTGDCHYAWALLKETTGNERTRYFKVKEVFSGYAVDEEFAILEKPLSNEEIISALVAHWGEGSYGPLVPKPIPPKCPTCHREQEQVEVLMGEKPVWEKE